MFNRFTLFQKAMQQIVFLRFLAFHGFVTSSSLPNEGSINKSHGEQKQVRL